MLEKMKVYVDNNTADLLQNIANSIENSIKKAAIGFDTSSIAELIKEAVEKIDFKEFEDNFKAQKEEIKKISEQFDKLKLELNSLQQKIIDSLSVIPALRSDINLLEKSINAAVEQNLKKTVDDIQTTIVNFNVKMNDFQKSVQETLQKYGDQMMRLNSQLTIYKEDMAKVSRENFSKIEELKLSIAQTLKEYDGRFEQIVNRINAVEKKISKNEYTADKILERVTTPWYKKLT
jgi:predicted  nucleic acid-binding Zn-ribbon protein